MDMTIAGKQDMVALIDIAHLAHRNIVKCWCAENNLGIIRELEMNLLLFGDRSRFAVVIA
jgi:hypothetical protein